MNGAACVPGPVTLLCSQEWEPTDAAAIQGATWYVLSISMQDAAPAG